jgi:ubiquinone/menaquinone biosynthesis C-methylase UbiE
MVSSINQKLSREEADYKRALEIAPYADDEDVGRRTAEIVGSGHGILQIHRLATDDETHVHELLAYFDPPPGARVLDAGCGVGRVAELMARERPDLEFVLLNISRAQLDMCPADFERVCGSFEDVPLPGGSVDAVMFLYSLGHGRLSLCLGEAARLLRSGGVLFVYDLTTGDSRTLIETLGYKAHARGDVESLADAAEFDLSFMADRYAEIFAGVRPILYRFIRR